MSKEESNIRPRHFTILLPPLATKLFLNLKEYLIMQGWMPIAVTSTNKAGIPPTNTDFCLPFATYGRAAGWRLKRREWHVLSVHHLMPHQLVHIPYEKT